MPCTPGPGGVAEEHRNTPGSGVAYGSHRGTGRARVCHTVASPTDTSPPTWIGLSSASRAAVRTWEATTVSAKPGAYRSMRRVIVAVTSTSEPAGTWQYDQTGCSPSGARVRSTTDGWTSRVNGSAA